MSIATYSRTMRTKILALSPDRTVAVYFLRIWWLKALLCLVGENSPDLNLYYYLPY